MNSRLVVLIPDSLSAIVEKGEFQPRYYNPGNFFEEVHLVLTNFDDVDPSVLQHTVGKARLFVHPFSDPTPLIYNSPYFKEWLLNPFFKPVFPLAILRQRDDLRKWARPIVNRIKEINPSIIRCHANDFNSIVAAQVKHEMGIPYVVSLHINPDVNPRRRSLDPNAPWQDKLFARMFEDVEVKGLRNADLALPVYQPIIPYLESIGCLNYEVAYNVLSDLLQKKDSYELHDPVQLISVGRHFGLKNPDNIIRAVADLPGVHFTLVGSGPLQGYLEDLVNELGVQDRIKFLPSVSNADLCAMLPNFDAFVIHSEHWEISKSLLEALLTGLPVIVNYRSGEQAPELKDAFVHFVQNTKQDYFEAIQMLLHDHGYRENLGRSAYTYAQDHWAPEKTEAKYVEIYKKYMLKD
jgi:glycosyltransferase involved in cell wall biosynthesis